MATIENASIKSLLNYEISRANEVTKQSDTTVHNAVNSLIEYGKRSALNCETLTEFTLDSDVSAISIDVTAEMKEKYEAFILDFNLTFSESDWLYFGGNKSPKQFYFNKGASIERPNDKISLGLLISKNPINNDFVNVLGFGVANLGNGYLTGNTWEDLSAFIFSTYVSGVTIQTGSTIKLRGVKQLYVN